MSKKPENPQAFPYVFRGPNEHAEEGMTLRDWFAGMAMQGFLAAFPPEFDLNEALDAIKSGGMAKLGYIVADTMLAEREK